MTRVWRPSFNLENSILCKASSAKKDDKEKGLVSIGRPKAVVKKQAGQSPPISVEVKKKRGRPRKNVTILDQEKASVELTSEDGMSERAKTTTALQGNQHLVSIETLEKESLRVDQATA